MTDIDNGTCMKCGLEVVYEGQTPEFDDEFCLRTKPYCTAPEDEHIDWRATCLHVQASAAKAEARVKELESVAREAIDIANRMGSLCCLKAADCVTGANYKQRLSALAAVVGSES